MRLVNGLPTILPLLGREGRGESEPVSPIESFRLSGRLGISFHPSFSARFGSDWVKTSGGGVRDNKLRDLFPHLPVPGQFRKTQNELFRVSGELRIQHPTD